MKAFVVAGLAVLIAMGGVACLGAKACSRQSPHEQADIEAARGTPPPAASGPALAHPNADGPALAHPNADGPALAHPSGLVLGPLPTAYRVREMETGFHVEPANAGRLRNPWSVEIRLADAAPRPGSEIERKKMGDRDVQYAVTVDEDTGSGGPLHTLTAWSECRSKRVVITAKQQVEAPASPDWSAAWTVFGASRCEPGG